MKYCNIGALTSNRQHLLQLKLTTKATRTEEQEDRREGKKMTVVERFIACSRRSDRGDSAKRYLSRKNNNHNEGVG